MAIIIRVIQKACHYTMARDATIKCSYWIFDENFINHLKCNHLITIFCYFSESIVSIQRRSAVIVEKAVNSNVTVLHQHNVLTYLLHGAQSFLRSEPVLRQSRNSLLFMEPEGSWPHSQVPPTCPHPQPDQSSPYPHIPLPKIHLNIILPFAPGFPFQQKTYNPLLLTCPLCPT